MDMDMESKQIRIQDNMGMDMNGLNKYSGYLYNGDINLPHIHKHNRK